MLASVSDRQLRFIERAATSCSEQTTTASGCTDCCYHTYGPAHAPRAPVTPWQDGARSMCLSLCTARYDDTLEATLSARRAAHDAQQA